MNQPLPLVLIPGRMSTAVSWRFQIEAFSQDRQVIVPDRHYRMHSVAAMARSVAEGLPERFDIAAWSMGGYILFELWPMIRHRVRRLILVATSARPESEASRQDRLEGLELAMREGLANSQKLTLAKAIHDASAVPDGMVDAMNTAAVELGLDAMHAQFAAIVGRRDQRPMLATIDVPTLIIVGDHDTVTPVDCALELARGIRGARLHILPGSGHCPPIERREMVNGLMSDFLAAEDFAENNPEPEVAQIPLARET